MVTGFEAEAADAALLSAYASRVSAGQEPLQVVWTGAWLQDARHGLHTRFLQPFAAASSSAAAGGGGFAGARRRHARMLRADARTYVFEHGRLRREATPEDRAADPWAAEVAAALAHGAQGGAGGAEAEAERASEREAAAVRLAAETAVARASDAVFQALRDSSSVGVPTGDESAPFGSQGEAALTPSCPFSVTSSQYDVSHIPPRSLPLSAQRSQTARVLPPARLHGPTSPLRQPPAVSAAASGVAASAAAALGA